MSRLRVARTGAWLATSASLATTPIQRMVGLLGHAAMAPGEALIFPRCRSIHTIGMRFPIDVVFIDQAWQVVGMKARLAPGVLWTSNGKAWGVVELEAGKAEGVGVQIHDRLELVDEQLDT